MAQMGASAVAARLRRDLRRAGVSVPRGRSQTTRDHPAGLTGRQAEVLALLAEDLSNPQIADRMFVSIRTVENHVSGRQEAVSEGRRRRLIPG
jgi:DNA-binding NarL/FixJ family response regulator